MMSDDYNLALEWLDNVKSLIEGLSDEKYFTEELLKDIITVELQTKSRSALVRRLHGRYCRLRQKKEWRNIRHYLDNDDDIPEGAIPCWSETSRNT